MAPSLPVAYKVFLSYSQLAKDVYFYASLDKNVSQLSLAVTKGRKVICPHGLNEQRHKPYICSARGLNLPHNIPLSLISLPAPLYTSQ